MKIKLGKHNKISTHAMLGVLPEREIPGKKCLEVGDNAVVRSGTVIYAGTKIGKNLQTGHNAIIREENRISDDFCLWSNSIVDYGCSIGRKVKIHSNCYIAQYTVIEDNVFIAPGVIIANDIHPGCRFSKNCMKGPTIKENAKIGANTTILPFVTIGRNSLVGAGSVVTKDIPDNSLAYGVPAKAVKKISEIKCIKGITGKPYSK